MEFRPVLFGYAQTLIVLWSLASFRFLFRRDKRRQSERDAAMDDLFATIRQVIEVAAELKPEWSAAWANRDQADLPPKYQPDQYLYPDAVAAAYDAKFTRALLYQNRWKSRTEPLFERYDGEIWTRVRATIERTSMMLLRVRGNHPDAFMPEEASWIDRAVEGIDEARYVLRRAKDDATATHETVAAATFQTLYSLLQLSETMLDGLRREMMEK